MSVLEAEPVHVEADVAAPPRIETPMWLHRGTTDLSGLEAWLASADGRFGLDTETTGLDPRAEGFEVCQLALGCSDGSSVVVDGGDVELVREVLLVAFSGGRKWYAHNAAYDAMVIQAYYGVRLGSMRDTLTAARCAYPGRLSYSLKTLRDETSHELEALRAHWEEVSGRRLGRATDKTWLPRAISGLPPDDPFVLRYVATDAVACARLAKDLAELPEPVPSAISREVRQEVLWRSVALDGIAVDRDGLLVERDRIGEIVSGAEARHGVDLSRNSHAVRKWVADRGITLQDRNGKDTLSQKLWGKAQVPEESRADWEEFCRVRDASTTVNKIGELLESSEADGRIHPAIGTNGADQTGRMSVRNPAVQNLTAEIRGYLVSDPGKVLVGLDLDQVEPRVVAGLSEDTAMREAIFSGDVYMAAADLIWTDPPESPEVRADRRKKAKVTLLAQIYGQGSSSLAAQLGLAERESKRISTAMLKAWPNLRRWIDSTRSAAEAGERLTTWSGRLLPACPEAPYKAVNWRVQGSAADIFKSMVSEVSKRLDDYPGSRLWLPVHDELVVECAEGDAEEMAVLLGETMRIELFGIPIGGTPSVLGHRWLHA